MINNKQKSRIWLHLGLADVIIIVILSLISSNTLQAMRLTNLASLDKLGHFLFYGFAAFCFGIYYKINNSILSYPITKIFSLLFTLGAIMEWLQYFSNLGRQFDYLDLLANTFGILAGCLGAIFYFKLLTSMPVN